MSFQERIPPLVYRLTLTAQAPESLALAQQVLILSGFSKEDIVTDKGSHGVTLMVFREKKESFDQVKKLLKKLSLAGIHARVVALKPDDWASKWKKGWTPARLTKALDVVPLWHRKKYHPKKGRGYILMDSLMSFGTGLHETTRLVAQMIEDYCHELGSFLDIGTGTGILSLVALKHGAHQVLAVDIGELSVEAAKKNAKANRLPFKVLRQDIAQWKHNQLYDVVAANLVTHDLVSWREQIVRCVKPNGLLAVSGISLDNWSKFEKGFIKKPLVLIRKAQGKQWAGALLRKTSTPKTS